MRTCRSSLMSALGLALALTAGTVVAEEAAKAPSKEVVEQAVKKELSKWAVVGQQQMIYLTEHAIDQYEPELLDDQPDLPAAWMLMKDGKTIKRINIDDQAGEAPATVRLLMYRAALKSIARQREISAGAILYTGKVKEGSDERALVVEYEHRLGISANKVIPFEVKGGKVLYGEPVTKDKPFQLFYDSKEDAAAQNAKNAK